MTRVDPDRYDRVAKLLVDAGDVETFLAAEELLRTYRLQIWVGAEACASPAWQAALLTAINAGKRAVHGGVGVELAEDAPCSVPWARGQRLSEAVRALGGEPMLGREPSVPAIAFGSPPSAWEGGRAPLIRPWAGRWTAGLGSARPEVGEAATELAGTLVGALAVSEAFQWLRGYGVAGERDIAVSLWEPGSTADGPPIVDLPAGFWLLGLGHLGQAYAWLLALLPYPADGTRVLVLLDDDRVSAANRATSMLHREEHVGLRKTRLTAHVMEPLGWDTALIERRYGGGQLYAPGDPAVLLGGVDNPQARRLLDESAVPVVYDAGLGAGPDGFLGMTVRRLPGARSSRELWPETGAVARAPVSDAYAALEAETGDGCGVEQLAGRTVATSFVGVTAACWVIGGLLRELHGGTAYTLVDHSLRDPNLVTAVEAVGGGPARVPTVPCRL